MQKEKLKIDSDKIKVKDEDFFLKIKFIYHRKKKYCDFEWNEERGPYFNEYSKKLNEFQNALRYIPYEWINEYLVEEYNDKSDVCARFEVPTWGIDKVIDFQKLREYRKKMDIIYGVLYFHCEIEVNDEKFHNVICNNGGLFTLENAINNKLLDRIKKYGKEFNIEDLKKLGLQSNSGWKFSIEAVKELAKNNRVFIDFSLYRLN